MSETLPEWDLSDLYEGLDDSRLANDIERLLADAGTFSSAYKGRIAGLATEEFAKAVLAYESLIAALERPGIYLSLARSTQIDDENVARTVQTLEERANEASESLLFFVLEINRIDDSDMAAFFASPWIYRDYSPWLRSLRAFRSHDLGGDVEAMLHKKSVVGAGAFVRLYEDMFARFRFDIDGQSLTESDTVDLFFSSDPDIRRKAACAMAKTLGDNRHNLAFIYNTIVKDKEIEDTARGFAHPLSSRLLENRIEEDVVEALVSSVRAAYPRLSHRYYALKAKWLGMDAMRYEDRNAPLAGVSFDYIPWDKAKKLVRNAYARFNPEMGYLVDTIFSQPWIDAAPRAGKDSGAFSMPGPEHGHPYILMNYHGRPDDVLTLAHEVGHSIHQILSRDQGALMRDAPLTFAETASVFGEMLAFQLMLDMEQDPARRRSIIASKVEAMLDTVTRQISIHEFERRVHEERRHGELAADRIDQIWLESLRESLGPKVVVDDVHATQWARISHAFSWPFYVHCYAFGDCLVNSLYARHIEEPADFWPHYNALLSSGNTMSHKELLAPFGLDASDPAFWNKGLSVIESYIDLLEAMDS